MIGLSGAMGLLSAFFYYADYTFTGKLHPNVSFFYISWHALKFAIGFYFFWYLKRSVENTEKIINEEEIKSNGTNQERSIEDKIKAANALHKKILQENKNL